MLTYQLYEKYRDKKGWTNHKVSLATGIPRSTFSAWKSGQYNLSIDTQMQIAKVLNIPARELISRKDIKSVVLKKDRE